MTSSTLNCSNVQRTTASTCPDRNLIPPALQGALNCPPKLKSKPLTAESLAALCAQLELSTTTATANATPTTTTSTATTITTTTTAVSSSARTGNSSIAEPLATDAPPCLPLPLEKRFDVLRWMARPPRPDSPLFSFSKASKGTHGDVLAFLNHDIDGRKLGNTLRWKANAAGLVGNGRILRQPARNIDLSGRAVTDAAVLDVPKGGVVKILAPGIGRTRALAELPKLLAQVPSHAMVALDLSSNGLTAEDLASLLKAMECNPVVYQLSLDNNPLCQGDEVCTPLVNLFSLHAPVSHLYLSQVGLNDASAVEIGKALAENHTFQHVDLRGNRLNQAGAIAIVEGVVWDTSLRTVRLQGNQFGMSEEVSAVRTRAHVKIGSERRLEKGQEFDPTREGDEVEIIQIDGVSAGYFHYSPVHQAFQRMYESAAMAERI